MTFNCRAAVRLGGRLNCLGHYWRSVLNAFIFAKEPDVFETFFSYTSPRAEAASVGGLQARRSCDTAAGVLHLLEKFLFSDVFPAFRDGFSFLPCDGYQSVLLRYISITWICADVYWACPPIMGRGEWIFMRWGVGRLRRVSAAWGVLINVNIPVLYCWRSSFAPASHLELLYREDAEIYFPYTSSGL